MDVVGAREGFFVAVGGTRREEAAEGGVRRAVEFGFCTDGLGIGFGGGGISEDCGCAKGFGLVFGMDGGGGIFCVSETAMLAVVAADGCSTRGFEVLS